MIPAGPKLSLADTQGRMGMADGKKKWIQKGASKHPGLFAAKARGAGKTTREYAAEKKDAGGTLGKEANFAANAMSAGRKARAGNRYTHASNAKATG